MPSLQRGRNRAIVGDPSATLRPVMALRLAILLLLGCASTPALATELRQSPGDGCGETSAQDPTNPRPAEHRGSLGDGEDRAPLHRGVPENGMRAPRWHSFLPGMFR